MSVLKDMSWKSSSCSAQNKCPVFFLRSSHHFGPQKDFKESNLRTLFKKSNKSFMTNKFKPQCVESFTGWSFILCDLLRTTTLPQQSPPPSKPGHAFSHPASIYSLEEAEGSFSMLPLIGHTCRGVSGPDVQSAPGTHTPTAALIIPDTHPTGLVFKVELGSHNWSNRIMVHELLPCLTPKLHKTCKAACSIPFLSAPFPIKPLTPQLKHIFLKPKYCFYCCSWEYRKSLWFFSAHVWLFVLYTVASIRVELFQPQHKGSQCELRSSFQHWAEP